eukprot:15325670-Heterocapsa_arctica.AAC.1
MDRTKEAELLRRKARAERQLARGLATTTTGASASCEGGGYRGRGRGRGCLFKGVAPATASARFHDGRGQRKESRSFTRTPGSPAGYGAAGQD